MEVPEVSWLLIHADDADDPVKVAVALLDGGRWQPIEGGWIVAPPTDPREANAARQARHRARKSNARVTRVSNARVTDGPSETVEFGGDPYPPPGPLGPGGVGRSPESNGTVTHPRNAPGVTESNAAALRGVTGPRYDDPSWRMEPRTEEDRERAQAHIRELADQLRATRAETDPT